MAETGLIILGKGILFATTVYAVCQVIADRITTVWSPSSGTNPDIIQKFKAMIDSKLTVAQQVTEALELVTYLLTPVAFYSV